MAFPPAVLAGGVIGAVLLIASEFATLYSVNTAISRAPVETVAGHNHNGFAFIPIAVLALVLAYGASRQGSRPALLALGLVGILSLTIAVAGDLPDSHKSGLLGSTATRYVTASSSAGTGLYLETLGSVVLIISCGAGFILAGSPPRRTRTTPTTKSSVS